MCIIRLCVSESMNSNVKGKSYFFAYCKMTDTPPSDGPAPVADFDMMSALDWKDGIATLPGSDIRVSVSWHFLHLCDAWRKIPAN